MSEKRILIASLLKPVNDTRMYEKLALTLCRLPQAQVHVCGFAAPPPAPAPENLHVHPLFRFGRLRWGRVRAQRQYYRLLRQLRPHLIIVCTHELLLPSMVYLRRHRCRLVYDVQENYQLNLLAQQNYRPVLKHLLAFGVRRIETFAARYVAHYLLAEQSYAHELPFLPQGRYTVVQNKYKTDPGYQMPTTPVQVPQGPLRLLYSGTISEVYGVLEAIALADAVQALRPGSTLTIIGYCAHPGLWRKVQALAAQRPHLQLIGGDQLVPHQQIVAQIRQSDVGLLPYRSNPSTFRCLPTKLYEYAAHALPMVVQHNPLWQDLLTRFAAGVSIDFAAPDAAQLLARLQQPFYTAGVPAEVFWETEEANLLAAVAPLLAETKT